MDLFSRYKLFGNKESAKSFFPKSAFPRRSSHVFNGRVFFMHDSKFNRRRTLSKVNDTSINDEAPLT